MRQIGTVEILPASMPFREVSEVISVDSNIRRYTVFGGQKRRHLMFMPGAETYPVSKIRSSEITILRKQVSLFVA
jgi:hypothetical protein